MNKKLNEILTSIIKETNSAYTFVFKREDDVLFLEDYSGKPALGKTLVLELGKIILGKSLTGIKKSTFFKNLNKKAGINDINLSNISLPKGNKYILVTLLKEKLGKNDRDIIKNKTEELKSILSPSGKEKRIKAIDINLFENLLLPFLLFNKKGNILLANRKAIELFKVENKESLIELIKKSELIELDSHRLNYDDLSFNKILKDRETAQTQKFKMINSKVNDKWFSLNSFIIKDNGEEFVGSFIADISKEMEEEINLKETFGSIQSLLYSTNADGSEYYFITDAVRNLFGFTPEEVYNNKFLILRTIAKEHFLSFRGFIDKLRNGEPASVEYRMKDRFGKEHWVRHTGTPLIRNGKVQKVVGMIHEITEEKITQLKLESSEEKFRMLIDTADDLIFILNGFGYISMVNKNGANTLGYMPEEMIGKHFLDFIDKDDESVVMDALGKILKTEEVTSFETTFIDRFEKGISFEINAKPFIRNGEVSGMISIGRNITGRKLDEQKIRELNTKLIEANRIISIERERARQKINVLEELHKLKSEFISNISHELRTPLASVVGFAETIVSDPDLPKETVKEFSEIILSEGKRLAKLINDVLDFSRLESGEDEIKFEEVGITKILDDVVSNFQNQMQQKQIHLSKEFPGFEILISADSRRISQAFSNLLSNAIKYTKSGGRISLIINNYDKEIEVAISDTGIGIPESEIPKLFQRFTKIYSPGAPVAGAGFGLAVVKQIIDLHKGFIRVNSEVNKGTSFIIRLPKRQFK